MAADFELLPLYGQQTVVRNRTSAALNFWAGQNLKEAIPATKPAEDWVKKRILAGRVTQAPSSYLDASLNIYTQQDGIQNTMRDLMDGFPTSTESTTFTNLMTSVTPAVMAAYAQFDVNDTQVEQWYIDNGFGPPPEA